MIKFNRSTNSIAELEPFPSFGVQTADGSWRIQVNGWAFFPYAPTRRKRLVLRMLGGVMQATEEELQSDIFKKRVHKFVSDGSAGHEIFCRLGPTVRRLNRKNKRNGHFRDFVRFEDSLINEYSESDENGRRVVPFEIQTNHPNIKPVESFAYLLPSNGVSVISDIDDTIKVSDVGDRRQLLANTFLREFRGIDGMANLYEKWSKLGADFHYVSSSPWQLHEPLLKLQTNEGFPGGTFHLRNFKLRQHMVERALMIRRHGKSTSIKSLFKNFPKRKFILVGDSGEKDPEIYRKICRKYTDQVSAVFFRNMPHKPLDPDRLTKCRESLAGIFCDKFESAEELEQMAAPFIESA